MPLPKRTLVIAACAAALAWTVTAGYAAEEDTAERLKRLTVSAALDGPATDPGYSGLLHAVSRAAAILGFEADTTVRSPEIILRFSGNPIPEARFSRDGRMFLLDLHGAIVVPEEALKRIVLDGGNLVTDMRTYLAAHSPLFVTRLEVELDAPAVFDLTRAPGEVRVRLVPVAQLPEATALAKAIENRLDAQAAAVDVLRAAVTELTARNEAERTAAREKARGDIERGVESLQARKLSDLAAQLASLSSQLEVTRSETEAGSQWVYEFAGELRRIDAEYAAASAVVRAALEDVVGRSRERITGQRERLNTELRNGGDLGVLRRLASETEEAGDADARLFASVLAQARQTEQGMGHRYAALAERMAEIPAPTPSTSDKMAQLDQAIETLRSGPSQTQGPLEALEAALARVDPREQTVDYEAPATYATLTDIHPPAAPPAKRERPGQHSLTAVQDPAPIRVEFITTSQAALAEAERQGMLVLAQQPSAQPPVTEAENAQPESVQPAAPEQPGQTLDVGPMVTTRPSFNLYNPDLPPDQDPLQQPVNIDFREMDLAAVVALLAAKAGINVLAGAEVSGTVTANLQNIPLGRAIEIVLRQNGLGIVEEDGVFVIKTYEEAVASRRETRMIFLRSAAASEVQTTLMAILQGGLGQSLLSVSSNTSTNSIILSGPRELVEEFTEVVNRLDVAEPVIPTVTATIKLNYSLPSDLIQIINPLLSESGHVSGDERSRQLVVVDLPVKVEEVKSLIAELDIPVKQVSIEAMIIDALMADNAQTGIDWVLNAVRRQNQRGQTVGNLQNLTGQSDFTTGAISQGIVPGINLGGQLALSILSGDIDLTAAIAAEVRSDNAQLLANPVITTVENAPARISIAEEIPFQELTQTTTGPPIASTEFKEVGTVLEATPRVTHDNRIQLTIDVKQSDTKGESVTGVPPEDKREANTTVFLNDGQTVFIGGLRRFDDEVTVRKVPVLGDIPVLNLLFRNQNIVKGNLELLIFLTCHVIPDQMPELTPALKRRFDELGGLEPSDVDGTRDLIRGYTKPGLQRDPIYKWRKPK